MAQKGMSRVLGPYHEPERKRYRIVVVDQDGKRDRRFFASYREAAQVVEALRKELHELPQHGDRTVGEAMDAYEKHQRFEKGNKPYSCYVTTKRLGDFFGNRDLLLRLLDEAQCQERYDALASRVSVATHRNTLAQAKTFLRWCVESGYVATSPAERVKPKGKLSHGKAQLRVDEARAWLARAVALADAGEAGAVGAMLALVIGLRASEIVERAVRDVDDGGHLLWITASKTKAGRRRLEVPPLLQPYLASLPAGRKGDERLFGQHWRDWPREWVQRICREAKVPMVSAHGLRGTHATLATEVGVTGRAVAQALGHTSPSTTFRSYAKAESVATNRQRRVVEIIERNGRGTEEGSDRSPAFPVSAESNENKWGTKGASHRSPSFPKPGVLN